MDLQSLRSEIDQVDARLLELFLRRMDIVEQVAAYKIENGLPVLHPQREQAVIDWARDRAGEGMESYAEEFFTALMAISRSMQEQIISQSENKFDS